MALEEIQNKNWQNLIESLIEKVEWGNDNFKVRTKKESKMIKCMEKNYKVLRKLHDSIYSNIAENFQAYLFSLSFSDWHKKINWEWHKNEMLGNFEHKGKSRCKFPSEFFRFSLLHKPEIFLTTGQLYVPDGEKPDEVKGKKPNIKNYTKSLGGVIHTV